jgi:chemotaxis protein methyltransferase CheR
MSEADLDLLVQFVGSRTGTRLSRQQRERLAVEGAKHADVPAWLERLQAREGALELARLLAVVSVHKTDLFRDEQQLEALQQHVLRPLVAEGRPLRLWSAGCSTGEEVATLLVLLAEAGAHGESSVLGSDLSAHALEQARRLCFQPQVLARVPAPLLERYFRGGALLPLLQARARFLQHNLVERPYPFALSASGESGPFDVIVCRNVLIYFTAEAARETVNAFVERLRPGGVLVLSTAEPLLDPVPGLTTLRVPGAFFYQRAAPGQAPPAPPPAPLPPRPSAPKPRAVVTGEVPVFVPPEEEGRKLFELVLEWAAEGEDHPETEGGLRRALYLSPRLAGARYLLGLILERRGAVSEASAEYRRALQLVESSTAAPSAFFLNNERLAKACRVALQRCALP